MMSLRRISREEAIKLLMEEETANQVYVKEDTAYRRAINFIYTFVRSGGAIDIRKAEFYLEEEEEC